jgi:prophage regulatory protein
MSKNTYQTTNATVDRILRLPEVIRMTGVCRSTILVWSREGRFPTKVALGPRSIGWSERAVQAWITARFAVRETDVA